MKRSAPPKAAATLPSQAKTLAKQKDDFTSEGAPPPALPGSLSLMKGASPDFAEGAENPALSKHLEREQDA